MAESSKSKLSWFAGLFVRLGCVSPLGLMLWFALVTAFAKLDFHHLEDSVWLIALIFLLIGYTWAIRFQFPFFPSGTNFQRWLISSVFGVLSVAACCFTAYALLLYVFSGERGVSGIFSIWLLNSLDGLVSAAIGIFFIVRSRWLVEKLFRDEAE